MPQSGPSRLGRPTLPIWVARKCVRSAKSWFTLENCCLWFEGKSSGDGDAQGDARVDGQTLTVKYKGGEKKIIVPPDIPIVTYVPSDKSELKPGVKIFIFAGEKPDGTLQAPRVDLGKDGLTPPM